MSVVVKGIAPGSIAEEIGFESGDEILTINGNEINDVLDYQFYCDDTYLRIGVRSHGEEVLAEIEKDEDEDLGLSFETYLMDNQHTCRNNCIFCFVDQMPAGMRPSLYFKDDDARLSFLFGNYVTLTNMSQRDIDRIIKMHISPINVSVHTTNPKLRCEMMGNRFAGEKLDYVYQLAKAGIKLNIQIVLCRGLNDQKELERTMRDLAALWPSVSSVAVVPVGLTGYREGLYPLEPFDEQSASQTLDTIHSFTDKFYAEHGVRLIYPSDEFFILAKRPVPTAEYYGDFEQLENGVGMTALLQDEFDSAFLDLPGGEQKITCDLACGVLVSDLMQGFVDKLKTKYPNLNCRVHSVKCNYFGGNVTVTGLITGSDLIEQLTNQLISDKLLISCNMLRHEQDKFLDDMTMPQVEGALNTTLCPVDNDGYRLIEAILDMRGE